MTETDKKCEELVLSTIHKTFPDHKFIGEEGSAAQASSLSRAAASPLLMPYCPQSADFTAPKQFSM